MEPQNQGTSPAVPIAIICGFAMIAIAIFFTNKNQPAPSTIQVQNANTVESGKARPVDETDFTLGNPNAPILMIEYSDYDCPFCKQYHITMNQIMDEYGINGKLAWVYRQLPIGELHPNSPKISEAALCVGEIGREKTGKNDAFWTFTNLVFDERDFDAPTNVTKLPEYAEIAGVSRAEYTDCMDNGRMKERLTLDIEDAFRADAKGTPYTVLILGNQQAVISGAQPYEVVKGIVQNLIEQLDGTFDPSTVETTTEVPTNQRGVPILE